MLLQMCCETLISLLDMIFRFCFYICFLHKILSDACLLGYLGLGRGGAGDEARGWNHHWKDITHVSTLFWIKWSEILGTTARRDSLDCTCSGHICSRNVVGMGLGEGYLCWQKLDHCYGGGKLVWLTVHLLSLWSLCPQSWPMLSGIQVLGMHAGFMSTMYHFIHCTWVSVFVFLGELVPIPQSTKRPFIFLLQLVCYLKLHVKVLQLFSGCIHSYSKGWSLWNISLCIYTETLPFNEKKSI